MPPLSRIRLSTLEDLAGQLRFAPKQAVRRQLDAVFKLAGEIEPDESYDESWVVRRITGYKRGEASEARLVGAALLGELSAFAEHVSARAAFDEADFAPVLGVPELCKRWGVTRKTLERRRRHGLVGVRVRDAHRTPRTVFPLASVERFERAMQNQPPRPRQAPTPARRGGAHADDIVRSWNRGDSPAAIARRFGLTRSAVHHSINAARARLLRALDFTSALPDDDDNPPDALLAAPEVYLGLGAPVEGTVRAVLDAVRTLGAPDAPLERARAAAHHAMRARVIRGVGTLGAAPGSVELDEIETPLRCMGLLRVELVRQELGLITRSIEERTRKPLSRVEESFAARWLVVGIAAAAAAIDRFDPSKRGRLASPVSLGLTRALAPLTKRAEPLDPGNAGSALDALATWRDAAAPWMQSLDAPAAVRRAVDEARVPPEACELLRLRFGWGIGPPRSLAWLRVERGVTAAALARVLREAASAGSSGPPHAKVE